MQEELSQTLHCMHDQQAVMCVPINSMVIGKDAAPADRQTTGIGDNGDPSPTLQANHHHAVACVDKHMCSGIDCVPALEREGAHSVVVGSHWDSPANPHPPLGAIETGVGRSSQEFFSQRGSMLVSDVVSQYGDIAGAVTARNDSSPCADREPTVVCYENNPTDARQKPTDVSPSVLARWGTGGNQTPFVQTFSISENIIGRDPKNGGNHLGVSDGPQFTLDTVGVHGVSTSGFVRRLTTVECARLQGFPDHHTEIRWRRKRVTSVENGRKTIHYTYLPPPQGPQYKAYGNSMCVNVMEWLGRKIQGAINANSTSKMAR